MTTWDANGDNPQLVTGLGPGASRMAAANNAGIFVVSLRSIDPPFVFQAVIGRDGAAELMSYPGFNLRTANDINNHNLVVGGWLTGSGSIRGFIASAFGSEIQDLGLFPGSTGTLARAINDSGVIVGSTQAAFGTALYWHPGTTTPVDLNTIASVPGDTLVAAMDINNAGQVLARGFNGYYILTPIPEPAATAGMLLTFNLLHRRRR